MAMSDLPILPLSANVGRHVLNRATRERGKIVGATDWYLKVSFGIGNERQVSPDLFEVNYVFVPAPAEVMGNVVSLAAFRAGRLPLRVVEGARL